MNLSLRRIVAPVAIAFMLSSCATVKVTTDYDQTKDFAPLKTFAIHDLTGKSISSLNSGRIVNAVKAELKAKGYTEVTTNPDFLVGLNTIIKNKQSVSANTDFYSYGGAYRPYGYWGGGMGMGTATTTFNVDEYKDGSLIIDMVDAKAKKLFWEGIGNKEIDGSAVKNPDQTIADAVTKILASFPNAGLQPAAKKK